MQSFITAKFMLVLVILAGWVVVSLAILLFFVPIFEIALWAKIAGLVAAALSGLFLVALGQMGLATIATAENTKRMIELLEKSQRGGNDKSPTLALRSVKVEPTISKPR